MFEAQATTQYYRVTKTRADAMTGAIIGESRWVLYVNDVEVVTFMATPRQLHHLALGFLLAEDWITGLDDVASLCVYEQVDCTYWLIPALGINARRAMANCAENVGTIRVRLRRSDFRLPTHRVLTSGCGGGITFSDLSSQQPPLESKRTVHAAQLFAMMDELYARAHLYRTTRGVHTSVLTDGETILSLAEDVGRHNTLDKIRGDCLLRGIATRDHILLSTGRVSSEMLIKAARMRVPIVVSRTSPTSLALELARAWNMTLIGYIRRDEMRVYCGIERVLVG